jgi:multicomponent Na+:H+ antiporter subunit A
MGIITLVLSGFVLALLAPWLYRVGRQATGWLLAVLPLIQLIYFASFVRPIARGEVFDFTSAWVPSLKINLSFYLDGLSLIFALLISGIGALVVIYAGGYLAGHHQLGRFYAYLLMFMASMLGVVLADNVITLFVFWELTSLSSYLLIGFDHERETARAAALQALLVTGVGGLALLAGLLLLGQVGGSLELSALLNQGEAVRSHGLYLPILLLVLAGAFTKSAQVPFHFWLPSAMEAPTPVSAYLHSATMVKAGVYLLARLSPVLGGSEAWHYLVTLGGAVTMLVGAALALFQTDLKRLLAYSTVSALGILTLLIGLDTTLSMQAAMVFLLAHAFYKGALFLVAGAVDHETGTRDVTQLGGLRHVMPITAVAAGLAALSMVGLPPLLGFISKELLYEAKLQAPRAAPLITSAGVLANVLLVAVAGIAGIRPFLRERTITPKNPHEAPPSLWLGPVMLAGLGFIIGLLPNIVATPLVSPAVTAVRAELTEVTLALWHGLNPVLLLSVLTLASGVGVYFGRGVVRRATSRLEPITHWGPARWYDVALDGMNDLARAQTRLLQSGYLRYYLLMIIGTTVGLTAYTLAARGGFPRMDGLTDVRFYEVGVAALIFLAAVAAVRARSRLAAVAALGVVGYGVALVYVLFGAPDLAMTQVLIESLTVILLVLVFYHLPRFASLSPQRARHRDALVALATGGLMTALVLVATSVRFHPPISDYFAENSFVQAHGRNIVNVILVDFRGVDTLGEITVLALAGVGAYALLKLRLEKKEKKEHK